MSFLDHLRTPAAAEAWRASNPDHAKADGDFDPAAAALALVMEHGAALAEKDEWDLDDNFTTTEGLYSLYCKITGHKD